MINFHAPPSKRFELVSQIRDKDGLPTGKTKSISTDNSGELWQHFMKYKPKTKHKRSKKKIVEQAKSLPKNQEADKIVKDMAAYAEEVRKKKRNQDDSQQQENNDR